MPKIHGRFLGRTAAEYPRNVGVQLPVELDLEGIHLHPFAPAQKLGVDGQAPETREELASVKLRALRVEVHPDAGHHVRDNRLAYLGEPLFSVFLLDFLKSLRPFDQRF